MATRWQRRIAAATAVVVIGTVAAVAGSAGAIASPGPTAAEEASGTYAAGTLAVSVDASTGLTCTDGFAHLVEDVGTGAVDVEILPSPPACTDVTTITATGTDRNETFDLDGSFTNLATVHVDLGTGRDDVILPYVPGTVDLHGQTPLAITGPEHPLTGAPWVVNGTSDPSQVSITRGSAAPLVATDAGPIGSIEVSPSAPDSLRVLPSPVERIVVGSPGQGPALVDTSGVPWAVETLNGTHELLGTQLVRVDYSGSAILAADIRLEPWISLVYQRLLERTPAEANVRRWLAATSVFVAAPRTWLGDYRTDRTVVPAAFVVTTEFRRLLVDQLYQEVLGRTPDAAERDAWLAPLARGWTPDRVRASMAGSAEFLAHSGGTDAGFVDALFTRLLGRSADSGGHAYWLHELAVTGSRTRVAQIFLATPEAAKHHAIARYEQAIDRTPSTSSATYWGQQVKTKGELAVLVALMSSDTAVAEAQPG